MAKSPTETQVVSPNVKAIESSSINTSVGLTRVQRPKVSTRVSLARVLILTRVQSPQGWYCIYQIFQHLNGALN